MKNSPTFSIIVPACNTALYAKQLVTSLQAQTMPDFECIFVSETSTDNTFEVLSQLIRGDDRFQIVSLPCSGSASVSRNYGIDHAKNDYLLFVDGDDWIEPESLAYFREKLMTTGEIDLLAAAATVWLEKTNEAPCKFETLCPALPTDQILNGKNALAKLYSSSYRPATWLYVYRRKFLKENTLYQVPGRRHQDDEWTYRVFFAAQHVASTPFAYYNYRRRPGSVTTQPNPKSIMDLTDNIRSFLDFYRQHRQEMSPALQKGYCSWVCDFFTRYLRQIYYPQELRYQQFIRATATKEQRQTFAEMLHHSRRAFQILTPLFAIARIRPLFGVAQWSYLKLYWPLLMRHGNFGKYSRHRP